MKAPVKKIAHAARGKTYEIEIHSTETGWEGRVTLDGKAIGQAITVSHTMSDDMSKYRGQSGIEALEEVLKSDIDRGWSESELATNK